MRGFQDSGLDAKGVLASGAASRVPASLLRRTLINA